VVTAAGAQADPALDYGRSLGAFLVTWSGSAYGYGQVVHEGGALSGNNQGLTPAALAERIAASGGGEPSGNQAVVWANGTNTAILSRRFRPLQAGFTATPTAGLAPLTVQFTVTATPAGVADQGRWFFGDGGSSAQPYPQHTYTQTGVYTVSGRVTDTQTGEWDVLSAANGTC